MSGDTTERKAVATQRRKVPAGNRLLKRLPADERKLLAAEAQVVEFGPGDVLCRAGTKVRHVYFPRQGVLSLFAKMTGGPDVGVGLIRTDGMFGLGVAAGRTTSNLLAVSQGCGHGDRVETGAFNRLVQNCPGLKHSLFVYAHAVAAQMAQNIACTAFHPSRQRIARWMLDVTEGAQQPGFSSTQAAIAAALGLQRPAVSHVAADFQQSGLIRYLRGEVTILDRPALRTVACRCSIRFTTEA